MLDVGISVGVVGLWVGVVGQSMSERGMVGLWVGVVGQGVGMVGLWVGVVGPVSSSLPASCADYRTPGGSKTQEISKAGGISAHSAKDASCHAYYATSRRE